MKVIDIIIGVSLGIIIGTVAAVLFKVYLFFKLRRQKRLAPGYTGLAGFFAFLFNNKAWKIDTEDNAQDTCNTLEKDQHTSGGKRKKGGKNQTSAGGMELSEVKIDGATGNEGGQNASVDVDEAAARNTSNPFESGGQTEPIRVFMNPACSVDNKARLKSMDVPQLCAWLRDTVGVNESVLEACAAEGIDGATMESIVSERDTDALVGIGLSSRLKTNKLFGAWAQEC